jgi:hypothetical protein
VLLDVLDHGAEPPPLTQAGGIVGPWRRDTRPVGICGSGAGDYRSRYPEMDVLAALLRNPACRSRLRAKRVPPPCRGKTQLVGAELKGSGNRLTAIGHDPHQLELRLDPFGVSDIAASRWSK